MRALVLAILLVACGPPPINDGRVVALWDVPEHTSREKITDICMAEDDSGYCYSKMPIYGNRHHDRACWVRLRHDTGREQDREVTCVLWETLAVDTWVKLA